MNQIIRYKDNLITTAELRRIKQAKRRLSTAAPDLLAALKALVEWQEMVADDPIIDRAQAAIAKAEGRHE